MLDRLHIQHTHVEAMLDELREQVTVMTEVILRVEAVDHQNRVGVHQELGARVIDHTVGVDVTTEDTRGHVHMLHLRTGQMRVVHADGHQSRGAYKSAFGDAKELRTRLVQWLDDEGWKVRGGRIWTPEQITGYPAYWNADPHHEIERVLNGEGSDGS